MPSGRILVLSLAFGMYTRRTAKGRHESRVACTCTATSARAWLVNATCPSTPAVRRPVLRCVTCRTLISVFDQDRSTNFCRFLAVARSPSLTALKILHRSRRTRCSCSRQSTWSQASPSKTGPGPAGPFTEVSNLPLGIGLCAASIQRPTCPRQHPFQGRAPGPVSGQLSANHPGGVPGTAARGFLLRFRRRHSLLGHPVLPAGIPPPLLSAYRTHRAYPRLCDGPWQGLHVSHA